MDSENLKNFRALGAAICVRAIRDYIFLKTHHRTSFGTTNIDELERFFKSEEFLLYSGFNGYRVLEILNERIEDGSYKSWNSLIQKNPTEKDYEEEALKLWEKRVEVMNGKER